MLDTKSIFFPLLLHFALSTGSLLAQHSSDADQVERKVKGEEGDVLGVLDEQPDFIPEDQVEGNAKESHNEGGEEVFDLVENERMVLGESLYL